MFGRISSILETEGIGGLISRGYSLAYRKGLRRLMPKVAPVVYSDVIVDHRRVGDRAFLPKSWQQQFEDVPDYEEALIKGLRANVKAGDRIVVVGGGTGVTCVVAAELSCSKVICFEGDYAGVKASRETASLNDVDDRIEILHAIVAKDIAVYGSERATNLVSPNDLPPCDVLELDCEGAEVPILTEMKIEPRVVIVETHGLFGAPPERVKSILEGRGYLVEDLGIAEPRYASACTKGGINVLVGRLAA